MSQQDHDEDMDEDEEREHDTRPSQHRKHADTRPSDGLDRKEAARFAQDAFKESASAITNAKIGEEKKFLGLFKMDAGIVDMLDGVYNLGADYMSSKLRPQIFRIVEKFAPKAGLKGGAVKSVATGATIASTVLVKAGGYFGPIYEGISSQLKERRELARKLSPVLNDIKGNHSLAALYSISEGDNEVIYAHRHRLNKIAKTTNLTNFINLGLNAGPSLIFDLKGFAHLWSNRQAMDHHQVQHLLAAKPETKQTENEQLRQVIEEGQSGKHVLKVSVLGLLPQVASRVVATNKHKLHVELQRPSALEMILELNDQVSSNPEASKYEEPKGYGGQSHNRKEYPLEEYIMRVCIAHQKDMADINPNHSEIRQALSSDLEAAVKPLAEAIRKGDLSALSLVRLVGEGKIIKKQGRAVATPEDVKALIAKEAPKQSTYVQVDPAEYYKDAAFSREQLKVALKSLEGSEKHNFAAMFPDSILADAGMSKKEIKQLRAATLKGYDEMLGDAVLGLNMKSDEQLEKKGLAKNEVKQLRDAAEQIGTQGMEAVHELKTTPVHENGVDRVMANMLVHEPKYLGTLLKDGRKEFAEKAANDENEAPKSHAHQTDGHTERVTREADATNDEEFQQRMNGR